MRIYTTIRPTRDGNVIVELKGGRQVVFNDDGHGRLAADVADEEIASYILGFPNFHTLESAAPALEAEEDSDTDSQNDGEPAQGEADAQDEAAESQAKAAEPAPKAAKKTARKTAKRGG